MTEDRSFAQRLKLLKDAYSPQRFREQGHQVVDRLADHLEAAHAGELDSVIPWQDADTMAQVWHGDRRFENADALCEAVLEGSIRLHNPQYLGHQINAALPVAAIGGLMSDLLNNGMGVYEMGMVGTAMERAVTDRLAQRFGLPDGAGGFLTSGGTLGNLTALLTARSHYVGERQLAEDEWASLSILASEESHYCVERAAHVMGLGREGVIKVPCDDRYRMRTELLNEIADGAEAAGRKVFAVVGACCTTSTGAYDDLTSIGDFCQRRNVWFHVDGAHGAAAVFSEKYRQRTNGIELANSVIMDFHKLLMTPAITTAVVLRRWRDSLRTFATEAEYLWSRDAGDDWFTLAKRTFECTKSMMALKVYSILSIHGEALFDANVTCLQDRAVEFAEMIVQHPSFELAIEPSSNIVCFRYCAGGEQDKNAQLRQRIVEEGEFYIVQTELKGKVWLRCTVANPFTTREHLAGLLRRLEELAN